MCVYTCVSQDHGKGSRFLHKQTLERPVARFSRESLPEPSNARRLARATFERHYRKEFRCQFCRLRFKSTDARYEPKVSARCLCWPCSCKREGLARAAGRHWCLQLRCAAAKVSLTVVRNYDQGLSASGGHGCRALATELRFPGRL